jgi:hypothetical protein
MIDPKLADVGARRRTQSRAPGSTAAPYTILQSVNAAMEGVESSGTGQVDITFDPAGVDGIRQIERAVISTDSAGAPVAGIYMDSVSALNLLDYASSAAFAIADEDPPIRIPASSKIIVRFTGLSAGARVRARLQFSIIRL